MRDHHGQNAFIIRKILPAAITRNVRDENNTEDMYINGGISGLHRSSHTVEFFPFCLELKPKI